MPFQRAEIDPEYHSAARFIQIGTICMPPDDGDQFPNIWGNIMYIYLGVLL
jgi:hypothetical protein